MHKNLLKKLKFLFNKNLFFFIPYLLFLIAGLFIILFTDKEYVNIYLNRIHNNFYDTLFQTFTFFGNGIFIIAILIPFLILFKVKYALQCSFVYSISGLIAQLIKHLTDLPRPLLYLQQKGTLESLNLYIINNTDIFFYHSFPSGHSATAFSFCLLLSLIIKQKFYGAIFFVIALFIGLSRVYLLQHFFIDIYIGSIIGVLTTITIYIFFEEWKKINETQWYNWSLGKFFKTLFAKNT